MAHMNQEKKKRLAPAIKKTLQKYGLKGSLSVNHYSTLILTISSGAIDFIGNYNAVIDEKPADNWGEKFPHCDGQTSTNIYHLDSSFTGYALQALEDLKAAMNDGNFDKSDIQTDYFHVGWYSEINIGKSWPKKDYTFPPSDKPQDEKPAENRLLDSGIIAQIADLTDKNNHTESIVLLTNYLEDVDGLQKSLEAVMTLHKYFGHLPQGMSTIRHDLLHAALSKAGSKFANYDEIQAAF